MSRRDRQVTLAVVVPGSSVARVRERLVRAAEQAAAELDARCVVLSGEGEAGHMRDLWREPPVELVLEETATSTVENAARTLPLLLERRVRRAVVVCAPAHLPRARWIFRRVYGSNGIQVTTRAARVAPTPGAVVWELLAAMVARRQIRAESERP